jgi:hypothetical protein
MNIVSLVTTWARRTAAAPLPLFAVTALLAAAAQTAPGYVGQWRTFTDMGTVTALAKHGSAVYAATLGGVRRIDTTTNSERTFNNLDGITDPWITGLVQDQTGSLWAVARTGYLSVLSADGTRWSTHGGSYVTAEWRMNDRAVLSAGPHLYLGSQKGLALFDTRRKVSELTLTRFGNDLDVPVLSLLRRGDTLYVGTSAGLYKARLYFADPLNPPANQGYANPADFTQWVKVPFAADPARQFSHLAVVGDTVATFGPGTLLQAPAQSPVTVRAFAGTPLIIGSQTYSAPWTDLTSAVAAGGKIFVGGATGLAVSANPASATPDAAVISPLQAFPRDTVANIGAWGDQVYGQAQSGVKHINLNTGSITAVPTLVNVNPPGLQEELYYRFLRNTVVTPAGDVFVGSWGGGLVRRRANGQNDAFKNSVAQPSSCLVPFFPGDGFTVVHSLSRPYTKTGPGYTLGGLIFASVTGDQRHQLAYFDTAAGIVQCPTTGLDMSGGAPHAIHLYSDTLLGVATEYGVTFMKVREEGLGPRFEAAQIWTLPGSIASEAWDLTADGWNRPWVLIGDRLAYLDSLDLSTTRELKPIDNFSGSNCKSLESDPSGKLWVGCANGLYNVQTDPTGQITSVRRYVMSDGLPSLFIFDVTVDPVNGKVWVTTDRGVAVLQSASQPAIPSGQLAPIIPYPNPFRAHHRFVILNKLPAHSTVRIYNPTGGVIRIFHPHELVGNEAQWDGTNQSGQAVPPGVYMFSVTSSGTIQRGKIIVAR